MDTCGFTKPNHSTQTRDALWNRGNLTKNSLLTSPPLLLYIHLLSSITPPQFTTTSTFRFLLSKHILVEHRNLAKLSSMASSAKFFALFIVSSLFIQQSLGAIICEALPKEKCAFSIAGTGKRCVLEKFVSEEDAEFQCKTSEVVVEKMANYIETDSCVNACGVDRNSIGISSDSLLETEFASKLCSPACYQSCPNIVDLYSNLAAAEGAILSNVCDAQKNNPRRAIFELMSSGAAPGPAFSEELAAAPAPTDF